MNFRYPHGNSNLSIMILLGLAALVLIRVWALQPISQPLSSGESEDPVPVTYDSTIRSLQAPERPAPSPTMPEISVQGSLITDRYPVRALMTLHDQPPRWVSEGDQLVPGLIVEKITETRVLFRQGKAYYEFFIAEPNLDALLSQADRNTTGAELTTE